MPAMSFWALVVAPIVEIPKDPLKQANHGHSIRKWVINESFSCVLTPCPEGLQ